jgi:hypothetical protein
MSHAVASGLTVQVCTWVTCTVNCTVQVTHVFTNAVALRGSTPVGAFSTPQCAQVVVHHDTPLT